MQKYAQRDAQHRRDLQALGIDPDLVATSDARDEPEPQIPTPGGSLPVPRSSSAGKETAFQRGGKGLFCDYCGVAGHVEAECPHNMHLDSEESSSEEDEEEEENEDVNSEDGSDM